MKIRHFLSTIVLSLVAAVLLACGGGKEPVASAECIEYLEDFATLMDEPASTIKPARERHFEDWELEEFVIFWKWIDRTETQGAIYYRPPCEAMSDSLKEWLESDSGKKFQEKLEKWLETDEGKRYLQ